MIIRSYGGRADLDCGGEHGERLAGTLAPPHGAARQERWREAPAELPCGRPAPVPFGVGVAIGIGIDLPLPSIFAAFRSAELLLFP